MTNQAAQTMPEPIAAMIEQVSAVENLIDDASRQYHDSTRWADVPSVYDDSSSPTMQEAIDAGFNKLRDMLRDYAAAMLAAAPAASGGDGPAVASVSERVESGEPANDREALLYLMQQFNSEVWNCERCGHAEETSTMDSADFLRRYLAEHPEQALTQQRGSVWPLNTKPENGWTFDPAFLERVMKLAEQQDSGEFAPSLEGVETVLLALQAMGTTPQPGAEALRELVQRILDWQPLTSINKADRLYQILVAAGLPFESVTDELESLLARGGE